VRKRFRYPNHYISCTQPLAHLGFPSVVDGTECGAQSLTWIKNRLILLRNPDKNKGMAEISLAQQKYARYNSVISGRLSAKVKFRAQIKLQQRNVLLQKRHLRYEPINAVTAINAVPAIKKREACEVWQVVS
jgi:hypothetical protein